MLATRVTVGIDPGKGGAVVGICEVFHQSIPTIIRNLMPVLGTKRPEYDLSELAAIFSGYEEMVDGKGELRFYIERQQAMPAKMGGGAANYGRGYAMGVLEGALSALVLRYEVVGARRWQKDMLADIPGDNTKVRAEIAARRIFPHVDLKRTDRARKADSGVVDALLIAEWGRRRK